MAFSTVSTVTYTLALAVCLAPVSIQYSAVPYRSRTTLHPKITNINIYTYTDQMRLAACSSVSMNYIKRHASPPYCTQSFVQIVRRRHNRNKKDVLARLLTFHFSSATSAAVCHNTDNITTGSDDFRHFSDPEQTNTRLRVCTCCKDRTWTPPLR